MLLTPKGYEKYRGKGTLVSANLMKAFRKRELLPTKNHVIYSFRHAFEKRMQEANIDYALRCLHLGHKNDRPAYGDGGSMEYRRNELLKIKHPFRIAFIITAELTSYGKEGREAVITPTSYQRPKLRENL